MNLYEIILKKYDKIEKRYRITFFSTFIIGFFAHIYMLVNIINNYDNIAVTPNGYGVGIQSGRWALTVLGDFNLLIFGGNYNIPLFNGLLAILFIALSSVVIIRLFNINDLVYCVLVAGVCVSFPTVTSSMFFTYTVHFYSLALFLAVFSVLQMEKGKIILPAIFLAISLGIYQAYFPVSATMSVLLLALKCLEKTGDFKKNLIKGIKWAITLVLGIILYYLILQILLNVYQVSLNDYQGISEMGLNIKEIPSMLRDVYYLFFAFPFKTYYSINNTLVIKACIFIIYIVSLILSIYILYSAPKERKVKFEVIILMFLFPIALNFILFMCYHSNIYTLMVYSLVFIFLLPVCLIEQIKGKSQILLINHGNRHTKFLEIINKIAAIILSIVIITWVWLANGNYNLLSYTDIQTNNYFVTLVTQIKSVEGYNDQFPIAFIGDTIEDVSFNNNAAWKSTPFYYGGNALTLINRYSRRYFIEKYLGYSPTIIQDVSDISRNSEVEEMPCYPDDGSIKVINDTVVIKLSEIE